MDSESQQYDFTGGFDLPAVGDMLRAVAAVWGVESNEVVDDISFHMTDWASDLRAIIELYTNPSGYTTEEASEIVSGFLVHVPAHVAAAAKLLTDMPVTDVFGVGAVKEKED